jgi:phenylpropionate dioxygenase-like ring-hydroxylating dioxygenase large terminal subunit
VVSVSALGREFVLFRGEDGRAGALHAFCPHLGTHLGHGGFVRGSNLVCPYHSWEVCDAV